MDLPVMPQVKPMLAKSVKELPLGELLYEPKWKGFGFTVVMQYGLLLASLHRLPARRHSATDPPADRTQR